jgi:dinuclear metal center YbgI/SA1388 family protein
MATVKEVFTALEARAPLALKQDWDNVGFLVGFSETSVKKVLVCLDITDDVVREANDIGAQLIVSHHPLFFSLTSVTDEDRAGRKITAMLKNGISAFCMHTNLDAAAGGVNDALAEAIGLQRTDLLNDEIRFADGRVYSLGRIGYLEKPTDLQDFMTLVKTSLNTRGIRYHDAGHPVHKVGIVSGSGGDHLSDAIKQGCDTFLTADIKYDVFLEGIEAGVNLIDADHFCTENVVSPKVAYLLSNLFPKLEIVVSKRQKQAACFC